MRLTTLVLSAFLLAGCAAKKLAVSNADTLLENQIEKRLPLYDAQKTALAKDVDKFLNDQKPFAREAIPLITDVELDVSQVDGQYEKLKTLYNKLALNFSRLMSKYMAPLDEKQQKDFSRLLKEENHKLSRSKTDERMEKLYDRFELMFGSVSSEQKKILESYKDYFWERHKLRVKRREKLHDRFDEIFKIDLSEAGRAEEFYKAFEDFQQNYPDNEKNKEIIKKIIPTLSLAQKEAFEERTEDMQEIIRYYLEASY